MIKSARIRNELESIIEASREHIHENFLMKTLQNSATNPLKADMSLEQLNEQYGCKFHKGFLQQSESGHFSQKIRTNLPVTVKNL